MYITTDGQGLYMVNTGKATFPGTEEEARNFCIALGMEREEWENGIFDLERGLEAHFGDVNLTYMYTIRAKMVA